MLKTNTKNTKLGKLLLCGLLGALPFVSAHAQMLYTTDFSTYTAGALAGQNGWATIGTTGATNPIQIATSATTNTNVAVVQSVSGDDENVGFTTGFNGANTISTVTISVGNLVVTAANSTAGSYFFAGSAGLGSTNYTGRVFAKSVTGGFQLGIIPSNTGTVAYGATLTIGTSYNLTLNYGFNAGVGDDSMSISINGATYATYATAFDFGATGGGSTTIGSVLLRQDNATSTGATIATINATANVVATGVPEPSTYAAFAVGLAALIGLQKIRRQTV